jgi:hypothetical protein
VSEDNSRGGMGGGGGATARPVVGRLPSRSCWRSALRYRGGLYNRRADESAANATTPAAQLALSSLLIMSTTTPNWSAETAGADGSSCAAAVRRRRVNPHRERKACRGCGRKRAPLCEGRRSRQRPFGFERKGLEEVSGEWGGLTWGCPGGDVEAKHADAWEAMGSVRFHDSEKEGLVDEA